MGALPTGVVSFVLTDIVDSTGIWERAPDATDVAGRPDIPSRST